MAAVFIAFATSPEPTVRMTAAVLAAALLMDLFVVHLPVLPAPAHPPRPPGLAGWRATTRATAGTATRVPGDQHPAVSHP